MITEIRSLVFCDSGWSLEDWNVERDSIVLQKKQDCFALLLPHSLHDQISPFRCGWTHDPWTAGLSEKIFVSSCTHSWAVVGSVCGRSGWILRSNIVDALRLHQNKNGDSVCSWKGLQEIHCLWNIHGPDRRSTVTLEGHCAKTNCLCARDCFVLDDHWYSPRNDLLTWWVHPVALSPYIFLEESFLDIRALDS